MNGTLAGVPIQNADGDLNAQGQAKGNAKITELGQTLQVDFVLVNKTFYLKGPTGGYQKIPAALAATFRPDRDPGPEPGCGQGADQRAGRQTRARSR